jgi:hypothetical protein
LIAAEPMGCAKDDKGQCLMAGAGGHMFI